MNNKKNIYTIIALTVIALTAVTPVFAAENNKTNNTRGNRIGNRGGMMRPGVSGTVTAISGNIITINGRQGNGANTTTTVFTIDATNAKITKSNISGTISNILVGDTISAQGTLSGTNLVATNIRDGIGMMRPGVSGTVTAINGNIITINGRQGFGTSATSTVFTIDATSAQITKNNTAGTIASIIIGDTISAQGTLSGTNLIATNIRDGIGRNDNNGIKPATNLNPITGNGQPVIAGTVTSINGNTVVITNNSNINFTIDATNAKIVQGPNTILVSGMTVGDVVIVQGTVNGNSITATSIIDRVKQANTTTTTKKNNQSFFGKIGSFFGHMFGF